MDNESTTILIKRVQSDTHCRREMKNIESLAASIERVGLLNPIVARPDDTLVNGARRLAAAKLLGWETIPCRVVDNLDDALKLHEAERDENTEREPYTPSEAVALGRALEALEKPRAEQRQREHGRTAPGRPKNTSGKLPEVFSHPKTSEKQDVSENTPSEVSDVDSKEKKHKRETRERVASAVGMSGKTYVKAKHGASANRPRTGTANRKIGVCATRQG